MMRLQSALETDAGSPTRVATRRPWAAIWASTYATWRADRTSPQAAVGCARW